MSESKQVWAAIRRLSVEQKLAVMAQIWMYHYGEEAWPPVIPQQISGSLQATLCGATEVAAARE